MVRNFRDSLPQGFHNTISNPVITMAVKPQAKKFKQVVLSLERMCLNLLTVGQQRKVDLKQLLSHELASHPRA